MPADLVGAADYVIGWCREAYYAQRAHPSEEVFELLDRPAAPWRGEVVAAEAGITPGPGRVIGCGSAVG